VKGAVAPERYLVSKRLAAIVIVVVVATSVVATIVTAITPTPVVTLASAVVTSRKKEGDRKDSPGARASRARSPL
jgi:hypothetical protein